MLCGAVITRRWTVREVRRPTLLLPEGATAEQCPGGALQRESRAGVCSWRRKDPCEGVEPNAVDRSPVQASYTWDHQRALYSVRGVFRKRPWVQPAVLNPSELWNGKGCFMA